MLDPQDAAASLAAIERAEQRTSQAVLYGIAGSFLMLWGAVTVIGYLFTQARPARAGIAWVILQTLGFVLTAIMIAGQRVRLVPSQRALGWRILAAQFALVGFGLAVITILGPISPRQIGAFWPLLFMLGYVLAGIWIGRFFVLCGIAIALLTIAGFWWTGPWFPLWMAAVYGGPLILGGLWLRRQGAEP